VKHNAEPIADLNGIVQSFLNRKNMENEHKLETAEATAERLAYSIDESAKILGLNYYTVYRLVQRRKLKACRVLRGKFLVPRSELIRLLNTTD
jgi:excisionase family DNA binding protein